MKWKFISILWCRYCIFLTMSVNKIRCCFWCCIDSFFQKFMYMRKVISNLAPLNSKKTFVWKIIYNAPSWNENLPAFCGADTVHFQGRKIETLTLFPDLKSIWKFNILSIIYIYISPSNLETTVFSNQSDAVRRHIFWLY